MTTEPNPFGEETEPRDRINRRGDSYERLCELADLELAESASFEGYDYIRIRFEDERHCMSMSTSLLVMSPDGQMVRANEYIACIFAQHTGREANVNGFAAGYNQESGQDEFFLIAQIKSPTTE